MRFFMASALQKWPNVSKLAMKWPILQPCAEQSDSAACHNLLHLSARRCGNDSSSSQFQVGCARLAGHNPSNTLLQRHRRCKRSQLQTFVICSASHTKSNKCLMFSFVHDFLGREGTFSGCLVNENSNIKVKQ